MHFIHLPTFQGVKAASSSGFYILYGFFRHPVKIQDHHLLALCFAFVWLVLHQTEQGMNLTSLISSQVLFPPLCKYKDIFINVQLNLGLSCLLLQAFLFSCSFFGWSELNQNKISGLSCSFSECYQTQPSQWICLIHARLEASPIWNHWFNVIHWF